MIEVRQVGAFAAHQDPRGRLGLQDLHAARADALVAVPFIDGTFASLEPFSQRLANWVRNRIVAFARAEDCDCASGWGCGAGLRCKAGNCNVDEDWPMCGWLWNETCDGLCWMGMD